MKLYNSLTKKTENFTPIDPPKVGMYTCGPTVYDFTHIGNFRTYIFEDILQRVLEGNDFEVKKVMNITDIEDKIIKAAKEKNVEISEFTAPFEKAFFEDLAVLNIKSASVYPKATQHIGEMIRFIEELIKKGLAYEEKDGSVYFNISKFPEYGKLSGLENRTLKSGTRILSDEYSKNDVQDFALWKVVEANEVGYDSPWGRGRPGWHIECSVMSQQYLGNSFDIHAGGVDLLFPHHENEIALSEGKSGQKFVNFFLEGEHLLVNGQKMAKSLKNIYTLRELKEKGFEPLALRYLFLTAHYKDKLNFTWKSLQAAQNTLNNIREKIRGWDLPISQSGQSKENVGQYWQRFLEAANLDLNMPQALAILHEMLSFNTLSSEKSEQLLKMDQILGLKLDEYLGKPLEISDQVKKLVEEREKVRKSGDFNKADQLRQRIKDLGFEVEDTPSGPKLKQLR